MRWNHAFGLLVGLIVAACGGHGATAPTAISPIPALPSSAYMAGTVSDTAFREVAGATIEIVNGPSAGRTTTSDGRGQWAFPPGTFDDSTQFRATKEGYEPAILPLGPFCAACHPNRWVNFVLKAKTTPANIGGAYAMTVAVDPSCTSFPEQVRTRMYVVTMPSPTDNAYFAIFPTGANFLAGSNQIDGGVSGNYVGFWFETLVEEVAPGNYLSIGMSAGGFVDPDHPATITTRGDGRISYNGAHCDSQQHTLVLTRR